MASSIRSASTTKKSAAGTKRSAAPVAKRAPRAAAKKGAPAAAAGAWTPPCSDEAVRNKTGKVWAEWCSVLDAAGAKEMIHKEIARYLATEQGVPPWWSQMVTVGYERARERRVTHETATGFAVSASRTIGAPVVDVYAAWTDAKRRARWMGLPAPTIRRATTNRSLRLAWTDGTATDVMFYPKGAERTQVTVDHRKLRDAGDVARLKTVWTGRLDKLQGLLEP